MTATEIHEPLPAERRTRCRVGGGSSSPLWGVLAVCAVLVGLAWRPPRRSCTAPPAHYAWDLAGYPALAQVAEPFTVHSRTGVTLVGRFFAGATPPRSSSRMATGAMRTKCCPSPTRSSRRIHRRHLQRAGARWQRRPGYVGSPGDQGSPLRDRHGRPPPGVDPNEIAEFGFSIGSDISILEAAHDPRIKAVVAEPVGRPCGYMKSNLGESSCIPRGRSPRWR